LPEYCQAGIVREPAGSALPGITPSNAYNCVDGLVLIAGNGDGIYRRLMETIGREDLRDDPELANNAGRAKQADRIDGAIGEFTAGRTVTDVIALLEAARVPVGRVYTAKDIAEDPQYQAREMLVQTTAYDGEPLTQPGIVPKLSATPGQIVHRAPKIGEHTDQVLKGAGFDESALAELRQKGVIK
ncbi:MAG: CoA transferase, partial [Burkholderiaceae bacterium]